MTKKANKKANNTWYLDFYALKYICNNRRLFLDMRINNNEFITTEGEIIQSLKVETIYFHLQIGIIMTLLNIIYVPKCNSNLILLGQI